MNPFAKIIARTVLCAAAAAVCSGAAMAQVSANNFNFYPTPTGMWSISPAGKVSYCQAVMSGTSGAPLSKCAVIGSIGATQVWTTVINTGPSTLFAINRQTGAVVSCTLTLMGGTNPHGGCAIASTLPLLQ